MSIKRRYSVRDFLNEDAEQVDEFFIRSMKKRPKPKYDDDDFQSDDKVVDYNKLISFDRNRIKSITSAISANLYKYINNAKEKKDTLFLHFRPTVRSSIDKVKKQLEKLKNILKIEDIQVHLNSIRITMKSNHKYT
tara:strand:+ start:3858 stop:4265 length:408 start_codon:yes stop_codon:yes gene_type:complete